MERDGGKARGWILHVHFWWQFFFFFILPSGSTRLFLTSRFYTSGEKNFFCGSASVHLLMVCTVDDGLLLADSCFLHLPMHPRCQTAQYLLLMSELESLTRPSNTDEQRIFDNGTEGGESSLFPRKLVFLEGGCLNCRQLYLACLLLFEHSSKYKQDALHATFPLLRTPPPWSLLLPRDFGYSRFFPFGNFRVRNGCYVSSLRPFSWKQRRRYLLITAS